MSSDETRLLPDLQFSVLSDDVRQEITGKFMLIGLFEAIKARRFPVRHPLMFVTNRWCNGQGDFRGQTRIVTGSNETLVEGKETPFTLASTTSSYTIVERFDRVTFPAAGTYWVEILLDGNLRQRFPLTLVEETGEPPPQ